MSLEIHEPDGHGTEQEIYAFISVDENNQSGICACQTVFGFAPMVGMTLDDMDKYSPMVAEIRKKTNKDVKLIRYKAVEVIGD